MGRTLIEMALASADLELVAAVEAPGSPVIGKDAGELVGRHCGVKIASNLRRRCCERRLPDRFYPSRRHARVPGTVPEERRAHGDRNDRFSAQQDERIAAAAAKIAIVKAPNMSAGVNVAFKLVETAARTLGDAYDVEILEAHHRHKIDAPSGTALKFGDVIARALDRDLARTAVHGRKGQVGERAPGAIGFHSVRGGDIVGEHTVMFIGEGERVEITVRSEAALRMPSGRFEPRASSRTRNAASTTCRTCWGSGSPDQLPPCFSARRACCVHTSSIASSTSSALLKRLRGSTAIHPVEQPLIFGQSVSELRPRRADVQRDQARHRFGIERPFARQHHREK